MNTILHRELLCLYACTSLVGVLRAKRVKNKMRKVEIQFSHEALCLIWMHQKTQKQTKMYIYMFSKYLTPQLPQACLMFGCDSHNFKAYLYRVHISQETVNSSHANKDPSVIILKMMHTSDIIGKRFIG